VSSQLTWYVARASGLVAWGLSGASVIAGLALSGRAFQRRLVPPAWLADLHRFLGGLAVTFTVVHVVALLADDYVGFDVVDVLVPFAAGWRPGAVAWGVAAFYLLVAVELSSLLRRRLSLAWWRRLHLMSLPLFTAGTVHLLTAGSDAANPAVRGTVWATVTAVVFLGVFRVLVRPPSARRAVRRAGVAARGRPDSVGGPQQSRSPVPASRRRPASLGRRAPAADIGRAPRPGQPAGVVSAAAGTPT
jgi:DMSO/TMAO reductase YedYZ heme-binding membrane subunit